LSIYRARRSVGNGMLWISGSADFIEGIYQGVFSLRSEREMEIDGGVRKWWTEGFPVGWDSIPGMFDTGLIPTWYERHCQVGEGRGGNDR
jgi:hypothetical protein